MCRSWSLQPGLIIKKTKTQRRHLQAEILTAAPSLFLYNTQISINPVAPKGARVSVQTQIHIVRFGFPCQPCHLGERSSSLQANKAQILCVSLLMARPQQPAEQKSASLWSESSTTSVLHVNVRAARTHEQRLSTSLEKTSYVEIFCHNKTGIFKSLDRCAEGLIRNKVCVN